MLSPLYKEYNEGEKKKLAISIKSLCMCLNNASALRSLTAE